MKFLKKAVSCVLAGVMSLAVLTACGGSSSGGSLPTGSIELGQSKLKSVVETLQSGTYTYNAKGTSVDDETGVKSAYTFTVIKSGENYYVRMENDGEVNAYIKEGNDVYIIELSDTNHTDESLYEKDGIAIHLDSADGFEDEFDMSTIVDVNEIKEIIAGKETYEGTEYYTEKVTTEDDEGEKETTTLFFVYSTSEDTLKYANKEGEMIEVTVSSKVDTSKLTVSGKTIVEADDYL